MWQQFIDEHPDAFAFLSVAVDAHPERAAEYARPYRFPTAVDSANVLGRLFDFDVVPNGLLIDEVGALQFLHIGGFYLSRPDGRQQVEALLHADFATGDRPAHMSQESLELEVLRGQLVYDPQNSDLLAALGDALLREGHGVQAVAAYGQAVELRPDDWSLAFALGTARRQTGDVAGAVGAWRRALSLDPSNFTVRKQIWREEHPECFYPTIDSEWQKQQLAKEGYKR
ncbi:MAG TPA: hypothetical protein VGK54_09845 [Chloroflexota bacterium]